MKRLGEILRDARLQKNITVRSIAAKLLLKPEIIEALENAQYHQLPEPTYVRGFIKNYAQILNLDSSRLLALYRAEFDEKKFPHKLSPLSDKRGLMFTPNKLIPLVFIVAVIFFLSYLGFEHFAVLSAPKLEIFTPQDDITTNASVIEVSGQTAKDATVSIDGQLIAVDSTGFFRHEIKLNEGRNTFEIIASRKLSPKTKITRLIRLSH